MRPRVCLAIVSYNNGKLTFRESRSTIEYYQRKTQFLKTRAKLSGIKANISLDLISFNNSIERSIREFKSKRVAS